MIAIKTHPLSLYFSPPNGTTNTALNSTLRWEKSIDPDRDAITYDVFLGTNNPPTTKVSPGQTSESYTPSDQSNSTTYYWKIVAKDATSQSTSDVRSYTTVARSNRAPSKPSLTSPSNAATSIALNTILTWSASSDPDGDAVTYDVFLGTNNPPTTKVSTGRSMTSYTPSGQNNSTTGKLSPKTAAPRPAAMFGIILRQPVLVLQVAQVQ